MSIVLSVLLVAGASGAAYWFLVVRNPDGPGAGQTPGDPETDPDRPWPSGGELIVRGCEPLEDLVPGYGYDRCGLKVLSPILAQLFAIDPDTAQPVPDLAESITTTDNTTFEITLKRDRLFHDGTPVQARNFVHAWEYTANRDSGRDDAAMFEVFAGGEQAVRDGAKKISGLEIVDDSTIRVHTVAPVSDLPARLAMPAFAPLPDSFFANPNGYAAAPIGAGPYRFGQLDTTQATIEKFAEYTGPYPGSPDTVRFILIADAEAAYAALRNGDLDYLDEIPQAAMGSVRADFDQRVLMKPGLGVTELVMAKNDPQIRDNLKLRQALSLAIDRPAIAESALLGAVTVADGWVPPFTESDTGACGEWCTFDADRARRLYQESGGYSGPLKITYNQDGNHEMWVRATCDSITNVLGLACEPVGLATFSELYEAIESGKLTGLVRTGWAVGYPSASGFLEDRLTSGSANNWSGYANPEFDAMLDEGDRASGDDARARYRDAESMLAQDLPTLPIWYRTSVVAWSASIDEVHIGADGNLDYSRVVVR